VNAHREGRDGPTGDHRRVSLKSLLQVQSPQNEDSWKKPRKKKASLQKKGRRQMREKAPTLQIPKVTSKKGGRGGGKCRFNKTIKGTTRGEEGQR